MLAGAMGKCTLDDEKQQKTHTIEDHASMYNREFVRYVVCGCLSFFFIVILENGS